MVPRFWKTNLKLYLSGQVPSLCGTLMQSTAQNWLVLQITHSAWWVGVNGFLCYFPTALLSLVGGIVVERWNIRRTLVVTQYVSMTLAFTLGAIVLLHRESLFLVNLFAALLGVVNAVDTPARYSLVAEIVPNEHLRFATGINSTLYNLSLAVGPAAAGVLIPIVGIGWTFVLNGVSYWGIIWALCMISPGYLSEKCTDHPFAALAQGTRFVFGNRVARALLFLLGTTLAMGYSFRTIFSVVAEKIYHAGPEVLGWLSASAALGSMLGALFISMNAKKHIPAEKFIVSGCAIVGVSLVMFSVTPSLQWRLVEVFISGIGMMFNWSVIQPALLALAPVNLRGRVSSWLGTTMYVGLMLGAFLNGKLAGMIGPAKTIGLSGIGALLLAVIVFMGKSQLRLPVQKAV